jgi:hypothetical protein
MDKQEFAATVINVAKEECFAAKVNVVHGNEGGKFLVVSPVTLTEQISLIVGVALALAAEGENREDAAYTKDAINMLLVDKITPVWYHGEQAIAIDINGL